MTVLVIALGVLAAVATAAAICAHRSLGRLVAAGDAATAQVLAAEQRQARAEKEAASAHAHAETLGALLRVEKGIVRQQAARIADLQQELAAYRAARGVLESRRAST